MNAITKLSNAVSGLISRVPPPVKAAIVQAGVFALGYQFGCWNVVGSAILAVRATELVRTPTVKNIARAAGSFGLAYRWGLPGVVGGIAAEGITITLAEKVRNLYNTPLSVIKQRVQRNLPSRATVGKNVAMGLMAAFAIGVPLAAVLMLGHIAGQIRKATENGQATRRFKIVPLPPRQRPNVRLLA